MYQIYHNSVYSRHFPSYGILPDCCLCERSCRSGGDLALKSRLRIAKSSGKMESSCLPQPWPGQVRVGEAWPYQIYIMLLGGGGMGQLLPGNFQLAWKLDNVICLTERAQGLGFTLNLVYTTYTHTPLHNIGKVQTVSIFNRSLWTEEYA